MLLTMGCSRHCCRVPAPHHRIACKALRILPRHLLSQTADSVLDIRVMVTFNLLSHCVIPELRLHHCHHRLQTLCWTSVRHSSLPTLTTTGYSLLRSCSQPARRCS